jgi:hypothetical protein
MVLLANLLWTHRNLFIVASAAMILVFFGVAGSFWWLTLTFNIFELIVLNMKRGLVKKIYYFQHIINWGVPTVCVVIGAPSSLPLGWPYQAPLLIWSANVGQAWRVGHLAG